jgi:SAM-dependent methyltransferase
MPQESPDLLGPVAGYYGAKVRTYGATSRGVDWSSEQSQALRFSQLLRILPRNRGFSVCDLGCGYGALLDRLESEAYDYAYLGVDISEDMLRVARGLHGRNPRAQFHLGLQGLPGADYCIASGILNVKLDALEADWNAHVLLQLALMNEIARCGFAFNCLTSYSNPDRVQTHLFYADPCALFDHCKRQFSRNVALLHDYGLYEFTMLVRKDVAQP